MKVDLDDDDKASDASMAWWDGRGAACVLFHDDDPVLLERQSGPTRLRRWLLSRDEAAIQSAVT